MITKNMLRLAIILMASLVSTFSEAVTQSQKICPSKIVYGLNQEATLKIFVPNKLMTAKVLPEVDGFEVFNADLGYKVSNEAIAGMKSTLDIASSMKRAVTVYYDDEKIVKTSKDENGYQIWSIIGPLPKSDSSSCTQ